MIAGVVYRLRCPAAGSVDHIIGARFAVVHHKIISFFHTDSRIFHVDQIHPVGVFLNLLVQQSIGAAPALCLLRVGQRKVQPQLWQSAF